MNAVCIISNSDLFDLTSFRCDFNFLEIITVRRLNTNNSIPACKVNPRIFFRLEITDLNRIFVVVFFLSGKKIIIARAIFICCCNFDFTNPELVNWLKMLLLVDVDLGSANKLSE